MITSLPTHHSSRPLAFISCSRFRRNRHHFIAILAAVLVVAAALATAPTALAAPIGASSGAGPSTTSTYNLAGTGWIVDNGSFPALPPGLQEVAYDPAAGPWHKVLAGGGGGDFAASDTGSGALMIFSVIEYVTIGGTTPWTDWHERIVQPGWRWQDDRAGSGEPTFTFSSGAPIPGLGIAFTDPTASEGGKIDFTFDPLPPGTNLKITKRLLFEGLDPLLSGETFLGKLDIYEHPTVPEPAGLTMALQSAAALALGIAGLRSRGRLSASRRT